MPAGLSVCEDVLLMNVYAILKLVLPLTVDKFCEFGTG